MRVERSDYEVYVKIPLSPKYQRFYGEKEYSLKTYLPTKDLLLALKEYLLNVYKVELKGEWSGIERLDHDTEFVEQLTYEDDFIDICLKYYMQDQEALAEDTETAEYHIDSDREDVEKWFNGLSIR